MLHNGNKIRNFQLESGHHVHTFDPSRGFPNCLWRQGKGLLYVYGVWRQIVFKESTSCLDFYSIKKGKNVSIPPRLG